MHRHFAAGDPSILNTHLTSSLNNFSTHLSHLGHHENALEAVREAVELFQQLAADPGRPGIFNEGLASSLNGLSARLSRLGYHGHALEVIQEAENLC